MKKLLILACIVCAQSASAIAFLSVTLVQDNWNLNIWLQGNSDVGDHDLEFFVDGQLIFSSPAGNGGGPGRGFAGYLPGDRWWLEPGVHALSATWLDPQNVPQSWSGASYEILEPIGPVPGTPPASIPDGGASIALLAIGLLGLFGVRHGWSPEPPL